MSGQCERPDAEADQVADETRPADAQATEEAESAEERVAELEAKSEKNWELYLRAAAETENVRKRAARDVEKAHKFALENFGRELLAVVDSLEIGLTAADSADAASLAEGSRATLKLLATTLERFGIVVIDPHGEPFDPEFHEAISMQPSADAEAGSVLTVVQKGYTLNGRLLRPARVIVAAELTAGNPD